MKYRFPIEVHDPATGKREPAIAVTKVTDESGRTIILLSDGRVGRPMPTGLGVYIVDGEQRPPARKEAADAL